MGVRLSESEITKKIYLRLLTATPEEMIRIADFMLGVKLSFDPREYDPYEAEPGEFYAGDFTIEGLKLAGPEPKATPLARKLALEKGIRLSGVLPSGAGGRIMARDVSNAHQEVKDKDTVQADREGEDHMPNSQNPVATTASVGTGSSAEATAQGSTARVSQAPLLNFVTMKTKKLCEVTARDVPPGLDPEDVATDV